MPGATFDGAGRAIASWRTLRWQVQELLERERDLMSRAFAPVDAVFDLLELVRPRAELHERTIHTLRRPTSW